MGTKWHMPLAVIDKPTGDHRQFKAGALSHRDFPLPLRYVHSDSGGHKEAVVVGRIDKIDPEADGQMFGHGEFYDGPEWPDDMRQMAKTARMLTGDKVIGPSVDLDEADMEQVPAEQFKLKTAKRDHADETGGDCGCGFAGDTQDMINLVTRGRIASATLVHIPAFAELAGHAILELADDNDDAETEFRNFDPGVGGGVDRDKLKASDFAGPNRSFPIVTAADVSDAARLIGKAADPEAVKARIIAIAKRKGFADAIPAGWQSVTAAAGPLSPPAAWFANPNLAEPTPLTITDDGRVYGHVAAWGTCHIGIGNQCVTPPHSKTGYAHFHVGNVLTAEGKSVAVGHLTYGTGHAVPNMGFRAASEHYDNSGNTGAVVRAGEDEHGIWVAGALVPDVDDRDVYTMRHTPLSGDWRRVGDNLEMVGALHVNTPGFPIPRAQLVVAGGQPVSLVAAGVLPAGAEATHPTTGLSPDEFGKQAAQAFLREQGEQQARRRHFDRLVAAAADADFDARRDEFRKARFVAARQALADAL